MKENYEDYSGGRVIYSAPGTTGFPVRLAKIIFEKAVELLKNKGEKPPYNIYDPFCGAAYTVTVLGFLYGNSISSIFASDIDDNVITLAQKNLSLLSLNGLTRRAQEIENMIAQYQKDSHREALKSLEKLKTHLAKNNRPIRTACFSFNILSGNPIDYKIPEIDLIVADLPYGKLTQWQGKNNEQNLAQTFLTNIKKLLKPTSVIVLSFDKKQKVLHEGYKRIKTEKLGKRKTYFLEPIN